jgi:hypothetical protein
MTRNLLWAAAVSGLPCLELEHHEPKNRAVVLEKLSRDD